MEIEPDRDRLQRMSKELYVLCESHNILREAREMAVRYGGIAAPEETKPIG